MDPGKSKVSDSQLAQRDKARGRTTLERSAMREEAILNQKEKKYYIQRIDDPEYLNHTIGPEKTVPNKEELTPKSDKWRRILMFEFLGCNFR